MALRTGHGAGAGVPRIEVLPADELPVGLPADARTANPSDRGDHGAFARGNTLAIVGGKAKAGKTRLASRMGLSKLPDDNALRPYLASAAAFRRAHCAELAKTVGGGTCGPAASSIVASAALQLAWSRYRDDVAALTNDPDTATTASRLGDAHRQNLLAAHELCAREATARPKRTGIAALNERLGIS